MRRTVTRTIGMCLLVPMLMGLSGCINADKGNRNVVTRFLQDELGLNFAAGQGFGKGLGKRQEAKTTAMAEREASSGVITELQARRTNLHPDSSYGKVAEAVMASSARAAEAELRGARLRAEAASKNWLPRLGPNISLNSLGEFVTTLLVEQVLFDNGRKKAERDYAAHDVELAAVALSEDSNARVHDALTLYLAGEEGRERISVADRSLKDMGHFEWVMTERVKGGISDRSDLNVIQQKLAEIRATRESALGERRAALAELAAMSGRPVESLRGVPAMAVLDEGIVPLSVLKAQAERDRTVAEAKIARAGHLPGLTASANVTANGTTGGIGLKADQLLGLGTGASLKAIEATKEGATRKVRQAEEDANRAQAAYRQRESALAMQMVEANKLARAAKRNLDLFQAQYKGGARQVMDVVNAYESWARQTENALQLKYDLARVQIAMSRDLGLLADGRDI